MRNQQCATYQTLPFLNRRAEKDGDMYCVQKYDIDLANNKYHI